MSEQGPLSGIRVVELASDHASLAARMMGDLGAEVIVVEPPGGHRSRDYGPFVDDEPNRERSLWWWYYNTSKLGVVIDIDTEQGAAQFARLASTADIVIEGEQPGRLAAFAIDGPDIRASNPSLIWVSVTPFGRDGPRRDEPATDLTLLAGGGPVWMCGYDDHTLPPVRGGGNQAFHTASIWAVTSALTAVLHRDRTGDGQLVDVNMYAAANVTTEAGTYTWLVSEGTVFRQTGRHASTTLTTEALVVTGDGRWIHTGFPPRHPRDYRIVIEWLEALGFADDFGDLVLLEMGAERGVSMADIGEDPVVTEIFRSGRDALVHIASRLTADEFFVGAQQRGLAVGTIYSPEEAMQIPHFVARGFPVEVEHADIGRTVTYPGAPFTMPKSPWTISRRAPHVGEHDDVVLGRLQE
jgi:crotonobetainyl-CoA:carnitine CoA-transferase CaiB-like acyl-CoA transferase